MTEHEQQVADLQEQLAAAQRDAVRRLKDRDAAWADIDALRSVLGLRLGEGLGLAEITACLRATNLTGDPVARAEQLSARVRELEGEVGALQERIAHGPPLTWVDDMYECDAAGRRDKAIDILYDTIDRLLYAGEFETVAEFMDTTLDIERVSTSLLLGVLTITLCAAAQLPSRADLVTRIEAELHARKKSPKEIEELLRGLRGKSQE
jgi:hypothetical protein